MTVTRRSFLVGSSRAAAGLAAGALASPVLAKTLPADPALPGVFRNNAFPFQHGVASGEPC